MQVEFHCVTRFAKRRGRRKVTKHVFVSDHLSDSNLFTAFVLNGKYLTTKTAIVWTLVAGPGRQQSTLKDITADITKQYLHRNAALTLYSLSDDNTKGGGQGGHQIRSPNLLPSRVNNRTRSCSSGWTGKPTQMKGWTKPTASFLQHWHPGFKNSSPKTANSLHPPKPEILKI